MILHRGVDDCIPTMINHPHTFGAGDDLEAHMMMVIKQIANQAYGYRQELWPFPCLSETQLVEVLWGMWSE